LKHAPEFESSALAKTLKSSLANQAILALILTTIAPAVSLTKWLNGADPEKLGSSPYYHIVQESIL
jgi:hypothetical protein